MARQFNYLTTEQQVQILKQRALELEADLYATDTEFELAEKLGLEEVQAGTEAKAASLAAALVSIETAIADLEGAEATPVKRTRTRKP